MLKHQPTTAKLPAKIILVLITQAHGLRKHLSIVWWHSPVIMFLGYEPIPWLCKTNPPSVYPDLKKKQKTPKNATLFPSLQNFEVALKQMSQTADTMEIVQSIMTENCSAALTPAARDVYNNQVVSS